MCGHINSDCGIFFNLMVQGTGRTGILLTSLAMLVFNPVTYCCFMTCYAACSPCPSHIQMLVAPMDNLPTSLNEDEDPPAGPDEAGLQLDEATEQLQAAAGGCSSDADTMALSDGAVTEHNEQDAYAGNVDDDHGLSWAYQDEVDDDVLIISDVEQNAGQPCSQAPDQGQALSSQTCNDTVPNKKNIKCFLCSKAIDRHIMSCVCGAHYHVDCLAPHLKQQQGSNPQHCESYQAGQPGQDQQLPTALPTDGKCPSCQGNLVWFDLLSGMKTYGWAATRSRGRKPRQVVLRCQQQDRRALEVAYQAACKEVASMCCSVHCPPPPCPRPRQCLVDEYFARCDSHMSLTCCIAATQGQQREKHMCQQRPKPPVVQLLMLHLLCP